MDDNTNTNGSFHSFCNLLDDQVKIENSTCKVSRKDEQDSSINSNEADDENYSELTSLGYI